jgi:hypothetical protein
VIISSYAIRPSTRSSTSAARSSTCCGRLQEAVREAYAEGSSARTSSAPGYDLELTVHAGAAPTSAARRRRCSTRSRATAGSRGCARRSRRRRLYGSPTGHQQRRVDRERAAHRAARRRVVPLHGDGEVGGLHAVLAVRARHAPGPVRSAARGHPARAARLAGGVRRGTS